MHKVIFLPHTNLMGYFNYHATAKKLIKTGKLTKYYFIENYNGIRPALILIFDDISHPVMPIRENHFDEYVSLIELHNKTRQTD